MVYTERTDPGGAAAMAAEAEAQPEASEETGPWNPLEDLSTLTEGGALPAEEQAPAPAAAASVIQTDFLSLNGQNLVALARVGTVTTARYLHPDLLGSPRKATSSTKALLWQEHYDPYGQKMNGVQEKIGYTGHAWDSETGYAYAQARFYDPLVGRFLSTDPVHFQDSSAFTFNRYSYANNNPYRYTDPTGTECTGSHVLGEDGACLSSASMVRTESMVGEPPQIKAPAGANGDAGGSANETTEEPLDDLGFELLPTPAAAGTLGASALKVLATTAIGRWIVGRLVGAATVGRTIAAGHAFGKHAGQFAHLGVKTPEQFARHIDNVMANASGANVRQLSSGRMGYWDDATGTVVIVNPGATDMGTAFIPDLGKRYFTDILK